MRKASLIFLILCSVTALLYASFVFSEYSAVPSTNKVTISWTTNSETGLSRFIVLRSTDDQLFNEIGSVTAKGSGSSYQYIDENVIFKVDQTFFYKIRAVRSDNTIVEETQSLIVNPNISGIFRTWGAIKAMFR